MTVYLMHRPKVSSVVTMKFKTYEEAKNFAAKSQLLESSKPYRRMMEIEGTMVPIWNVSLPSAKAGKATYSKREEGADILALKKFA
jgi:hypothetical protein